MSTGMKPILHHYLPSLFSEKVRALMGYLDLDWQSVIISPIMPRPNLMELSGGYRKTPIMQIGANVYCDTEIICRKLAELAGDVSLYEHGFVADRVARWADTELFQTTVALNFRPEAVAQQMSQLADGDGAAEAFMKDRAQLTDGAPISASDPQMAMNHFDALLKSLDASLQQGFLFGGSPSIADFSVYHCLWFVIGNPLNASLFEPYSNVMAFMDRMQAFGYGEFENITSEDALGQAASSEPLRPADADVDSRYAGDLSPEDAITVAPNDYGKIPVAGQLVSWQENEIVILRHDDKAGDVMVHFPNIGFEVAQA